MPSPGVNALSDDEARELFSAYHDRELSPAENLAVRAALEANPALQSEYKGFCAMLEGLQSMASDAAVGTSAATETPSVDVLRKVQSRIHSRSGGKFYRDRWSRTAGILPLEIFAAVLLVALVMAYFAMTSITVRPAPQTPATGQTTPSR